MARRTRSGTFVGPGIWRKWRPGFMLDSKPRKHERHENKKTENTKKNKPLRLRDHRGALRSDLAGRPAAQADGHDRIGSIHEPIDEPGRLVYRSDPGRAAASRRRRIRSARSSHAGFLIPVRPVFGSCLCGLCGLRVQTSWDSVAARLWKCTEGFACGLCGLCV